MKKLLSIIALALIIIVSPAELQAQTCRHTQPRCNCAAIGRQTVILHQLQDDLLFWQSQLQQDRTIWSPRIRYMRIKRDMNNIRSLQNTIAAQREYVREMRNAQR